MPLVYIHNYDNNSRLEHQGLGKSCVGGDAGALGPSGALSAVDKGAAGHPTKLETLRLADDADLFARLAQRGLGTVPRWV